jgi:hypothetical protein
MYIEDLTQTYRAKLDDELLELLAASKNLKLEARVTQKWVGPWNPTLNFAESAKFRMGHPAVNEGYGDIMPIKIFLSEALPVRV